MRTAIAISPPSGEIRCSGSRRGEHKTSVGSLNDRTTVRSPRLHEMDRFPRRLTSFEISFSGSESQAGSIGDIAHSHSAIRMNDPSTRGRQRRGRTPRVVEIPRIARPGCERGRTDHRRGKGVGPCPTAGGASGRVGLSSGTGSSRTGSPVDDSCGHVIPGSEPDGMWIRGTEPARQWLHGWRRRTEIERIVQGTLIHVREQHRPPCEPDMGGIRAEVPLNESGREGPASVMVVVQSQSDLLQVVLAGAAAGAISTAMMAITTRSSINVKPRRINDMVEPQTRGTKLPPQY
jgi:hypothetical protein